MDTQKLYEWKEEQQQVQINQQDNNIIQEDQPLLKDQMDVEEASPLQKKHEIVKNNMPVGVSVFSQRQSLIREGKYRFFDKKGNAHDAQRTTPSSKYMKPILDKLAEIDRKLEKSVDPADFEDIRKSFLDACLACENYLDNRNPWTAEGKARKRMVGDFYAQIRQESVQFEKRVEELKQEGEDSYREKTWLDILGEIRTQNYVHGKEGVKISKTGANASEVFVVEKNGKKKFFKQSEHVEYKSFPELVDESLDNLSKGLENYSKEEHSDEEINALKKKTEFRKQLLISFGRTILTSYGNDSAVVANAMAIDDGAQGLFHTVRKELLLHENRTYDQVLLEFKNLERELDSLKNDLSKLSETETEARAALEKRIADKEKEIDNSDYSYIVGQIDLIKRSLFQSVYAKDVAKIGEGEDISKRNVATSRMAKLLGLNNLIAKSEMATVNINGKIMKGVMMDEAEGKSLVAINGEANAKKGIKGSDKIPENVSYTPEIFQQLLNLQVLDVICGQTDRNTGNFICQYEEKDGNFVFKSIKGIDNDMSFGTHTYNSITSRGHLYDKLTNLEDDGEALIPFMDYNLVTAIRRLTPEFINHEMADILSKEERKALISRINGVKSFINKRLAFEEKHSKVPSMFVKASTDDQKLWRETWKNAMVKYGDKLKQARTSPMYKYSAKIYMINTSYFWDANIANKIAT